MPVPWETPSSGAPAKSGVPWEVEDTVTKSAYPSAEERRTAEQRKAENRSYVEKEQLRQLAGNKESRHKALADIKTKEELAAAYGFKPEDFNPDDLEQNFSAFQGYGYGSPQQKKGVAGSLAENAGAAIFAPLGAVKQAFQHGRAAISGSPESIQAKNLADLDARMYSEYKGASTEDHPIATTVGTMAGATPWALAMPSQTLGGAAISGAALGALTPETSPGNYFLQTLLRGGIGAAGGAAGNLLAKSLITGTTKGVAGVRGAIPKENLKLQNDIVEGLGVPPEQVTAADIATQNGVKTGQGLIARHRDLASMSGSRLPKIDETNQAALGSRLSQIQVGARRDLATTPFAAEGGELGPLTSGEALQGSLPMQKGILQRTKTGPAYDARPPMPPDSTVPHGSFLANLEGRVGELESMGQGSPYSAPLTAQGESPLKLLQQQLANIKGKPGTAPAVPQVTLFPPGTEKVVASLRAMGQNDAQIQSALTNLGYKMPPVSMPTPHGPIRPATPGMDTVYGLRQVLDNLKHGRNKYNTVGGNKLTHPITETIDDLEGALNPVLSTPEWQARINAQNVADDLHATYVAPYNQPLLKGLVRKGGQAGEEVLPGNAMSKAVSFSPDEMALLSRSLEQKGEAGLRSGLIDDLVSAATDPTKPQGMQIDPKMLLQKLKDWPGRVALKPEQLQELDKLTRALELMDHIGSRKPNISSTMDAATGLSSQRSTMKAITEFLARKTDWAQTSTRGKAMLLTPSAATDPRFAGTRFQELLQGIQTGATGAGVPLQERLFRPQNPVDRSQFE